MLWRWWKRHMTGVKFHPHQSPQDAERPLIGMACSLHGPQLCARIGFPVEILLECGCEWSLLTNHFWKGRMVFRGNDEQGIPPCEPTQTSLG